MLIVTAHSRLNVKMESTGGAAAAREEQASIAG